MINIINAGESEIWDRCADIIVHRLNDATGEGKKCLLLLSGGSAVSIYQRLAGRIEELKISSDNLAVGQVDERFQPLNPDDINAQQIEKSGFIDALKNKGVSFYKIPQTGNLREAAFNFEKLLKKLFINYDFLMAVMGIGKDGHTAGLMRGYRAEWDKDIMAIGYENRGEFPKRITMTPAAVRKLDYALVAAAGVEKQGVLDKIAVNNGEDVNNLPGILIHQIKEVNLIREL